MRIPTCGGRPLCRRGSCREQAAVPVHCERRTTMRAGSRLFDTPRIGKVRQTGQTRSSQCRGSTASCRRRKSPSCSERVRCGGRSCRKCLLSSDQKHPCYSQSKADKNNKECGRVGGHRDALQHVIRPHYERCARPIAAAASNNSASRMKLSARWRPLMAKS